MNEPLNALRDLTLSTPDLSALSQRTTGHRGRHHRLYESRESLDSADERKQRVGRAKREIKKQLSSRLGWRFSFARAHRPARGDAAAMRETKAECRRFYDEIPLSGGSTSSLSSLTQSFDHLSTPVHGLASNRLSAEVAVDVTTSDSTYK